MQKLFENWRNYQKEVLKEQFTTDALGYQAQGHTLDKLKISKTESAKLLGMMRMVASIGDPTGVLSWPEFKDATIKFKKTRTMKAGGEWLLALLAIIPVLGKAATPAKLFKLKNTTKQIAGSSKIFGKASDSGQMIADINKTSRRVQKELDAFFPSGGGKTIRDIGTRAVAKIPGLVPAVNAAGQKFGVFIDAGGRAFVKVKDKAGKTVAFMHSSGTSYLMRGAGNTVTSSPQRWIPIGPWNGRIYQKYGPVGGRLGIRDARFGEGDKELWDRLLSLSDEGYDYMQDMFGQNWARDIWDPQAHFLRDKVDELIKGGHITPVKKPSSYGKYPSPNSVFGQIGKKLEQLSPSGKSKELIDYFGPVRRGGTEEYNKWFFEGTKF